MTDPPKSSDLRRLIAQKRKAGWKNPYVKPDPPEGGTTEVNLNELLRAAVNRKEKP